MSGRADKDTPLCELALSDLLIDVGLDGRRMYRSLVHHPEAFQELLDEVHADPAPSRATTLGFRRRAERGQHLPRVLQVFLKVLDEAGAAKREPQRLDQFAIVRLPDLAGVLHLVLGRHQHHRMASNLWRELEWRCMTFFV